jgi:hypothetical protein
MSSDLNSNATNLMDSTVDLNEESFRPSILQSVRGKTRFWVPPTAKGETDNDETANPLPLQ